MAGVTPVGTWIDPDFETAADGSSYKTALDNSIHVGKRIADCFGPHAKATPDMNVLLDAGNVLNDITLTEIAQQMVGPFTAPSTHPRIDRIVIDKLTGVASIITGTQATTPAAPAITDDKAPVCQVLLQTSSAAITNAMITDERVGGASSGVAVKLKLSTDQTVTGTASETTVTAATKTIPGGMLGTENWMDFFISLSAISLGIGKSATLRAKYDGVTFAQIAILPANACSSGTGLAEIWIRLRSEGSAGAQTGFIVVYPTIQFKVGSYSASVGAPGMATGSASKDATSAKDFTFTIELADGSDSVTVSSQRIVKYS
jgi:hypothetical protein